MSAELAALVCSGPRRGKQHTYMLLVERAPEAEYLPRDEALGELAARFFVGHGPATVKDLAWWGSLTQAEARAGIARAGGRLRREEAGGLELWSADDLDEAVEIVRTPAAPAVHLIQGYDEIIMGHSETRWLLARPGSSWVVATPPVGRLVILLDGRVGGFWRRTIKKDALVVEAALFEPFDAAQTRALEEEAARYGQFLGLAASLVLAPAGPAVATRTDGGQAG
jgi:hypothetical protein